MKRFISLMLVFAWGSASAAPVTWVISDAVFDDGGTVTGQFDYDVETNSYTNISIQTSTKNLFLGSNSHDMSGTTTDYYVDVSASYSDVSSPGLGSFGPSSEDWLTLEASVDSTQYGDYVEFGLGFDAALTGAGGTRSIYYGSELFTLDGNSCGLDNCNYNLTSRNLVSGQVSAVPVPAAVWLFGSALAGLGWMRRKQAA